MPRTARKISRTGIYHVMLRGIGRQVIFEDKEDGRRFLEILRKCKEQIGLKIHAYCLMTNHVHLLVQTDGKETLGNALRRAENAYVYWYNTKYQRTGHLFGDRFRSETVEGDISFLRTLRYIIQNPMKAGMEDAPGTYPWSSYGAYTGMNDRLTDTDAAASMFDSREELLAFLREKNEDPGMEPPEKAFALTDAQAKAVVLQVTGCRTLEEFSHLERKQQRAYARQLVQQHLSCGQIARLTGLPKTTVHRAAQNRNGCLTPVPLFKRKRDSMQYQNQGLLAESLTEPLAEPAQDLRVGIVGLGNQGSLYAGMLNGRLGPMPIPKPAGLRLTAASSRSRSAWERLFEKENDAPAYFADWREMLRSDACDAVIVTVPHNLHAEITIDALNQGKHVLCEKPAAVRACEVRAMLAAKEQSAAALGMIFNNRANPLYQKCRALARSGELGALRLVSWAVNSNWRPDSYYASNAWRGTWKGEGGGLLVNQIAHHLDLLLWICGEPETVWSILREGRYRQIEVENEVLAGFSFANGATGELFSNGYDPFGTDRLELTFSKGKILLEDSRRLAVTRYAKSEEEINAGMDYMTLMSLKRSVDTEFASTETEEENVPFFAPYIRVFENFAAHVNGKEDLLAPAEAGLREVQLANAIYLSGWTGAEVRFPGDEEKYNEILIKKCEGKSGTGA